MTLQIDTFPSYEMVLKMYDRDTFNEHEWMNEQREAYKKVGRDFDDYRMLHGNFLFFPDQQPDGKIFLMNIAQNTQNV